MNIVTRSVWILAAIIGVSASASAADMPRKAVIAPAAAPGYSWYIEGLVGIPLQKDYDINLGGAGGVYEPDTGFYAQVAVGRYFAPNWRGEIYFAWARAKDGSVTFNGGGTFPQSGRTDVYSAGVNLFYTWAWTQWLKPYVGAGVGFAHFDVQRVGFPGGAFVIDGSDTTIVGLLHAGLDIPMSQQFTLTGRYTAAFTPEVSFGSIPAGVTRTRDSTIDHLFSVGGRWNFQ